MTKSRGINRKRKLWTAKELQYLVKHYPDQPTSALATALSSTCSSVYQKAYQLGLRKCAAYLASPACHRLNGITGMQTRFKPQQKPWNDGMKGLQIGGIATRFKKGNQPHNYMPVGSERDVDGYVWVKLADPSTWRAKHLLVYEATHGQPPPPGHVVIFSDGDRRNFDPSNLECITRTQLQARNSIHRYPPALKQVIKLAAKVRRKLHERSTKRSEGRPEARPKNHQ